MAAGVGYAVGLIDQVAGQIAAGLTPLRQAEVTAEAERLLDLESPTRHGDKALAVTDRVLGLGPVEPLMGDENVSDVLVNGPDEIWVERHGVLERADGSFGTDHALVAAVERIIAPLGLRVDRSSPTVDARLSDGSRLHAVVPPAAVDLRSSRCADSPPPWGRWTILSLPGALRSPMLMSWPKPWRTGGPS